MVQSITASLALRVLANAIQVLATQFRYQNFLSEVLKKTKESVGPEFRGLAGAFQKKMAAPVWGFGAA